eukprot:scaffold247417_cov16-Tisochrysis_lutea.AAC.1
MKFPGMLAADQAAPLPATTAPEAVLPAVTEGLVPLPVLLPAGGEAPPSAALTAASIQKSGDVICCEQELLSPQARTQVCEQQCGGEPQQEEHVKKKLTQPQPAERKPQLQGPFSHGSHLANLAKRSSSGHNVAAAAAVRIVLAHLERFHLAGTCLLGVAATFKGNKTHAGAVLMSIKQKGADSEVCKYLTWGQTKNDRNQKLAC